MGIFNIFKKKEQGAPKKTATPALPASQNAISTGPIKNAKPPSPAAAITTPIAQGENPPATPSASAKPQENKSNTTSNPAAPKPSAVTPPKVAASSSLPTPKSINSIGPSGRPPLSASQMIRPAGIKIPAKYVPPSGFRNLPPPPAPPGVPSSQQKNIQGQLQKTSQSLSNSLNGATPPKPKQILSSSAGHASEPLPPSPSIQDTHTPHTTASTTQALSKTPSPAEPIATNNNPPPTPPSSPQENKEKEPESLDLNTCKVEDLLRVPSLPKRLAEAIVQYRETQGAFRSLADLLQVPEMTPIAYTLITGQEPPENYKSTKTIYAHLSIPNEQEINAKTIVERIAAWPDVVGCILSNHESRVIAANLIGTISAEKLASSAKQFTSLTQDQLSSIHQSKAQEIIIPGLSATFYFIAGPQAILTLIYSIPTPPARHLEILREIITQIEIQ